MKSQCLTKKEKEFCRLYFETRDKRQAAFSAGFHILPYQTALSLLDRKDIQKELKSLSSCRADISDETAAGFRRLAFGSAADAVKLIFKEDISDDEIEELDLFMVSDIKKPKGGGIEIKFFDRLKALEYLNEMSSSKDDSSLPFYKALENSARKLHTDEDDNE